MNHPLTAVTLALSLTAAVTASPVGIYINDDFPGTTLDSSEWTTAVVGSATVSVASSYVTIQAASGKQAQMWSIDAVSPGAGQTVELTMNNLCSNDAYPAWLETGLTNHAGTGGITLKTAKSWSGHTDGTYLVIRGTGGSDVNMYYFLPSNTFYGRATTKANYVIDWSPNSVVLKKNDTVIFDSTVNAPTFGGTSWVLPTANLSIWGSTYVNNLNIAADLIKLEVTAVPEPAMASLALLGAAAIGLRRRRG